MTTIRPSNLYTAHKPQNAKAKAAPSINDYWRLGTYTEEGDDIRITLFDVKGNSRVVAVAMLLANYDLVRESEEPVVWRDDRAVDLVEVGR